MIFLALRARESDPLSASRSLMQLVRRGIELHLRAVCIHFYDRLSFFLFPSLSLSLSFLLSIFPSAQERPSARRRVHYCCNFVWLDFLSRTY